MRFLSPEWLVALDAALGASPAVRAATSSTTLRLLQVVTGGPDGDLAYVVAVDHGTVEVRSATTAEPADVTLATTWDTAVAIATGALAAHDAFTTGRLVVRGDVDLLRTQALALAGLDGSFAAVRSSTTY